MAIAMAPNKLRGAKIGRDDGTSPVYRAPPHTADLGS
jgi:hypothetical protein